MCITSDPDPGQYQNRQRRQPSGAYIYFTGQTFDFNPLRVRNPKTSTLANNEDPDEMSHNAQFHRGLQCLLRQNPSLEKEI